MHEYAVTKSILDMVLREAKGAGCEKVLEIRLVIGDLSTIVDDSVQLYFDIMSQHTAAQDAKLVFKRIPAQFRCPDCGQEYDKPAKGFDCPVCGSTGRTTGRGKEFYIESIEVE